MSGNLFAAFGPWLHPCVTRLGCPKDRVAQILYGDGVKGGTLQQCRTLVKAVLKHAGSFTQLEDPPAQSEGLLPLLLFDEILHATDPAFDRLEPEASNDRPVFSQLSQCRRDVLDKVAHDHNAVQSLKRPHANCAQKECLKRLAALSSSSDPGNGVQCNLMRAVFGVMAMFEGHCVLTEENIGSLAWKLQICLPVEGVVLKPDTEGITAALAVASTSPIFLLQVIDYSADWRMSLLTNRQTSKLHRSEGNQVDRILWKLILSAALGNTEPEDILCNFLDSSPIQRIMSADCLDKTQKYQRVMLAIFLLNLVAYRTSLTSDDKLVPPPERAAVITHTTSQGPVVGSGFKFPWESKDTPLCPLFLLLSRIQRAAQFARRRGLPSSTALQLVSAKCDELCKSLPPQKIPIAHISAEDVLDLSSVSARKPEITREFPPSLFPLLSKHREELGLMSQQLHGIAINLPWTTNNPIVACSVYILRVEQLLSQVS
ncbi:hypothetical protein B0H16DRAFT_1449883 [Mycena metata]|uniref:Uncharacterized protein n=1 Tax=Mycena metata TaxID=1033252 RepID=A0AAD7K1L9_9AGAR|nr:hypothetical protein B0H16DRAFT_1449883 [Mycena metata]